MIWGEDVVMASGMGRPVPDTSSISSTSMQAMQGSGRSQEVCRDNEDADIGYRATQQPSRERQCYFLLRTTTRSLTKRTRWMVDAGGR